MNIALLTKHLAFAGVDPRLLDEAHLRWFVDGRCRELGLPHATAYAELLARSPEETEQLVEAVVVGETRFFRDASVFAGIRAWADMQAGKRKTFRVLSAPCSTGQEPYSVAAILLAAGIASDRFTIDALDISASALAVAARGVYAESMLREVAEQERRQLASWHDDRWIVREELRSRVRFARANLAEPGALDGQKYDLILCRNLFIYLHGEARARLAASLQAALLPGGRLVIGTADHVPELNLLFKPIGRPAEFALAPVSEEAQNNPVLPDAENPVARQVRNGRQQRWNAPATREQSAPEEHSAEALHQRALECQRVGNVRQAERRCRQALYVDPSYLPAMETLDTLWHSSASIRLRAALAARIHRLRGLETNAG